jgi:hypothetical protein
MSADILTRLSDAFHNINYDRLLSFFYTNALLVVDGVQYEGTDGIAAFSKKLLSETPDVSVRVRRAFADHREPSWIAGEWGFRASADRGETFTEVEQALLLNVSRQGKIVYARVQSDPTSKRTVKATDDLRADARPMNFPATQGTMSRGEIVSLQARLSQKGWAEGNSDTVAACFSDNGVLQMGRDIAQGKDAIRALANRVSTGYAHRQYKGHRGVFDGANIAVHQSWENGKSTSDRLLIGVIQDGLIHYWREYSS